MTPPLTTKAHAWRLVPSVRGRPAGSMSVQAVPFYRGRVLTVESLIKIANVINVGIPDLFTLPTTPPRRRGQPPKKRKQA